VGDDEFGAGVLAYLRAEGVDAAGAGLDGSASTGVYFKERRASGGLRAHYYRAGSAASRMRFDNLDLEYLLSGKILHLTGITPALSESCREMALCLAGEANARGIAFSFDANVRFRLFGRRDPRELLLPMVERADLLFCSEEEARLLLGGTEPAAVREAAVGLRVKSVIVHGETGAFAVCGDGLVERPAYPVREAADTVGAGDAFVAGFLSGRMRGWDAGRCLELANACGACAVAVPGDAESMPFESDALALIGGGAKGAER